MRVLMISRPSLFDVPGGDTVQIEETARSLKEIGVEVQIKLADEKIDYSDYDLIHFFNIIRPHNIWPHVRQSKLPYVVSTIFVDYSEVEQKYRGPLFKMLFNVFGADGLEYMKTVGRWLLGGEKLGDYSYLWRGHKQSVERLLRQAGMLLPNSHSEFTRLKERYRYSNQYKVVPNAVDDSFLHQKLIDEENKSGVVCVGRIEAIKNQLNLIRGLKNTNIDLKIIGKPAPNHQHYYEQCLREATDNITLMGQLPREEVREIMSQSKVHVLPSFFETTGLSSLEAAALGCNLVITRKGDTEEYFGDKAFYCDPANPESIRNAVEKALNEPVNPNLRERVVREYRWNIAAKITREAYKEVFRQHLGDE